MGTALKSFVAENPADHLSLLRTMYHQWPFFTRVIENAQMTMEKADMGIAHRYASLVQDPAVGARIFERIRSEYETCREVLLDITEQVELLDNDPGLQRSLRLRNPYVDPLSYIQVSLPGGCARCRTRRVSEANAETMAAPAPAAHLTINGIATAMRSTG
jgi:phosphoenolpyruvate carboxylase